MTAYPRAQTVATFIICTVLVCGAVIYIHGNPFASKNDSPSTPITVTTNTSTTDQYINTADWKKTFFNVNDTDTKYSTKNATDVAAKNKSAELNATDLLGREFFSKFMTLRQAGVLSNTSTADALVNQVVENSQLITDEAKLYKIEDLNTITDESKNSLEIYANTVARILKENRPTDNEIIITKNALETGNPQNLSSIDPIINNYIRVQKDLLTTPVPLILNKYHIKLVNGISKSLANAIALRNASTDPLQAINAISDYQETVTVFFNTITDLRSYFNNKGISFRPEEEAYSVFTLK